jgi:hypothetical protein
VEEEIAKCENAYLEETSAAGNIVKGFDNYIKGSAASLGHGSVAGVLGGGGGVGSVGAGGVGGGGGAGGVGGGGGPGAGGRRRGGINDLDRVFSRSSVSYLGVSTLPHNSFFFFYAFFPIVFSLISFFLCLGPIISFCAYLCTHDAVAHPNPYLSRYTAAASVTARCVGFSTNCYVGSSSSHCCRSRQRWHNQAYQEKQTRTCWECWRDDTVDACSRSWDRGWWG